MKIDDMQDSTQKLQPTGIEGLDTMIKGGLPYGSSVLISGQPGTGKTILALNWLFNGYKKSEEAGLYFSMTEPVVKIKENARQFSFYDDAIINPIQIHFTDLRTILNALNLEVSTFSQEHVNKLVKWFYEIVKHSGAKRIVIDSISGLNYKIKDPYLIRSFIFELTTLLAQLDTAIFLISEDPGGDDLNFGVEDFIADGVIRLGNLPIDDRETNRTMQVVKLRGVNHSTSTVLMRITSQGIHVFPRIPRKFTLNLTGTRKSTGISKLDEMLKGGIFQGSTTLFTGSSGSGKTILGLQCCYAALKRGEKAIFVSSEESKLELFHKTRNFNWGLDEFEKRGQLKVITLFPEEKYLEEYLHYILNEVDALQASLVVLDSLSSLAGFFSQKYTNRFLGTLAYQLKARAVTSIYTYTTARLFGTDTTTDSIMCSLIDTLIMLRFIEAGATLKNGLMIIKQRGSTHDKMINELAIEETGPKVLASFETNVSLIGNISTTPLKNES